MNLRHFSVALVAVAACADAPSIRRERFARVSATERTGMVDEGPRGIAGKALSRINGTCEPGEVKSCGFSLPPPRGQKAHDVMMHCLPDENGVYGFTREECATPLVLVFDESPVVFTLADAAFAVGPYSRTEWVSAATPWLALDRDGSGCIESERELFAGFGALEPLDDNGDGRIDARDAAYAELVLWSDRDQDKRCTPSELTSLADRGVVAIDLAFVDSKPAKRGSYEGERAAVTSMQGSERARVVDVYLRPLDQGE